MSEEHIEVTASSALSVATYTNISPSPAESSDQPLPNHASSMRSVIGRLVRRGYGLFKLACAPREAFLLSTARPGTALARLVAEPGRKGALAAQPFVCAEWPSALRLRRMIEHCAVIDQLGHPFDINGDQYVEIIQFELDGEGCRLMLDRPKWLGCDGMLCVSLWAGLDRVFSVSFSLSDSGSTRTAYIGGIQGHRSGDALEQNRILTKAAHGMRPRDLAFELFRMMIPRMGVTELKGIADAHRYQLTRRARMTIGRNDKVQLDYDEIWDSRGGVLGEDGFYLVPIHSRRDIADIAAKKRSMYKRRYAMLDELQAAIVAALAQPCVIHTHGSKVVEALVS
jgi:uncharacterized protein VirK/YbjX